MSQDYRDLLKQLGWSDGLIDSVDRAGAFDPIPDEIALPSGPMYQDYSTIEVDPEKAERDSANIVLRA